MHDGGVSRTIVSYKTEKLQIIGSMFVTSTFTLITTRQTCVNVRYSCHACGLQLKNADLDLAPLKQAKEEHAKLQ
jgi:hypothetical protein